MAAPISEDFLAKNLGASTVIFLAISSFSSKYSAFTFAAQFIIDFIFYF